MSIPKKLIREKDGRRLYQLDGNGYVAEMQPLGEGSPWHHESQWGWTVEQREEALRWLETGEGS